VKVTKDFNLGILKELSWKPGWSHFVPLIHLSTDTLFFYLAFHSTSKKVVITIIQEDYNVVQVFQSVWNQELSHIIPFTMEGLQHILVYEQQSGLGAVFRITQGATIALEKVAEIGLPRGLTHFIPADFNGFK